MLGILLAFATHALFCDFVTVMRFYNFKMFLVHQTARIPSGSHLCHFDDIVNYNNGISSHEVKLMFANHTWEKSDTNKNVSWFHICVHGALSHIQMLWMMIILINLIIMHVLPLWLHIIECERRTYESTKAIIQYSNFCTMCHTVFDSIATNQRRQIDIHRFGADFSYAVGNGINFPWNMLKIGFLGIYNVFIRNEWLI